MPDPGGRGPLGGPTNNPTPDSGTSALHQHRAPVLWGRQDDSEMLADAELFFGIPLEHSTNSAALDAARFVIGMELKHRAGIHLYGEGTQSGSQSGDFKQAEIDKMSKGGNVTNRQGKSPINCTELPIHAVAEYFKALGRPDVGTQIETNSRDTRGPIRGETASAVESARLTALIREVHDRGGFETTYLGIAAAPVGQGFGEVNRRRFYPTAARPVTGADSGTVIKDVRAPVDRALSKYGNKSQRREYERFIQTLSRTKFAVGTVDGGYHGFVIADGKVYQVHWEAGSKSNHLFQVSGVGEFLRQYNDAIVAIPARLP